MDAEEFLKRLEEGERLFIDIRFPRGTDLRGLVARINKVVMSSVEEHDILVFDGCYFQNLSADGLYLKNLNQMWYNEKKLYFLDLSLIHI